ncbi:MAG TPA: YIP1 family protein [Halobacteriales archaeon]|nr:YIP1 family protein [Halobacteriales archaeon]
MKPQTPMLRPDRFFAERELNALRLLLVAVVLTFSVPVAVSGLGWILTERVDGTVVVDNPDRPSDTYCETALETMAEGCDAPKRIEQDVDVSIGRAVDDLLAASILAVPFGLLVFGGLLHAGSWLLDGENGAARSFAVALWGMAPSVLSLVVLLLVVYATFDPLTVTPDTGASAFGDHLLAELQPAFRVAPVASAVTTLWSGVIWRFGLVHERGLSGGEATGLAGGVAVLSFLVTLV